MQLNLLALSADFSGHSTMPRNEVLLFIISGTGNWVSLFPLVDLKQLVWVTGKEALEEWLHIFFVRCIDC